MRSPRRLALLECTLSKTISKSQLRLFTSAYKVAAAFLLIACMATALAQTATLKGLGTKFSGKALSRDGTVVVGVDTSSNKAAYWSSGTMHDLAGVATGSVVNSCNQDGTVMVGQNNNLPCIWESSILERLPLLGGTTSGTATLISANGTTVAGYCDGIPVVWSLAGVFALSAESTSTILNSISDDGSTIVSDLTGGYAGQLTSPNTNGKQKPGVIQLSGLGLTQETTSINPYFVNTNDPENDVVGYEDLFCTTADGSVKYGSSFDVYLEPMTGSGAPYSVLDTDGFWAVAYSTNGAPQSPIFTDFEVHSCNVDGSVLAGCTVTQEGAPYLTQFALGTSEIAFGGTSENLNKFLTGKGAATGGWTLSTVGTQAMSGDGSVIFGTGIAVNVTETFTATISPAVSSLSPSQSSFVGGSSVQATVGVDYPAPANTTVTVTSNNTAVIPSTSAAVSQGTMLGAFTLTSKAVTVATSVKLTATLGTTSKTATVTVNPPPTPAITGFYPSAGVIVGGNAATASVTLASAAGTSGYVVKLATNTAGFTLPATVTVASGQKSVSFAMTSTPVTAVTHVTLTATFGSSTETTVVTVVPPSVTVVRVAPSPVVGGVSTKVAVYLNGKAPTGGFAVTVASSSKSATVPTTITVPAGATAANATVTTTAVAAATVVVVSAQIGSITVETTMVVDP
ncbi:MAG TPA: hypothetical protein VGL56_20485 [Fimbriimonadaceae bacterium]|jgi:hypothetical protein